MKKTIAILALGCAFSIISTLLSSCEDCEGDNTKLRIENFNGELKKIVSINTTDANLSYFEYVNYEPDSMGIRYDSIGIQLYNDIISYAQHTNFNIINTALACEPVINFRGIDSFYVYSNQAYNDAYPAGTNLRPIIGFRANNMVADQTTDDIQGSIAFVNFKSSPSKILSHQLTLKYKLKDGRTILKLLPKLKILIN